MNGVYKESDKKKYLVASKPHTKTVVLFLERGNKQDTVIDSMIAEGLSAFAQFDMWFMGVS